MRKLTQVRQEYPKFKIKTGWEPAEDGGFSNPKFGFVESVVICKDDGSPVYDQYQIVEKGGAIVIPYYFERQLRVGLISIFRVIPADPKNPGKQGIISIETPRGFAIDGEVAEETAIRELGEETQRVVASLKLIGYVNPNTAFYKSYIPVFALEVDREKYSKLRPEAEEKIFQCRFYTKQEVEALVRARKIFCGLTKAALMDFFSTVGP